MPAVSGKAKEKKMKRRILFYAFITVMTVLFALTFASCGDEDTPGATDTADTAESSTPASSDTEDTSLFPDVTFELILDDAGKKVGRKCYLEDGTLYFEEYYDVAGRVTSHTDYNYDGTVSSVYSYTFLSGDTPDHYVLEQYNYTDGELLTKDVIKYNKATLIDSVYTYDAEGALVEGYLYEYNDGGKTVKESLVGSNNAFKLITEYEYREDGKVDKVTYRKGSGEISTYSVFSYNENGTVDRESNYDPEGTMTSYLQYVYDEDGNFVEEEEYLLDEEDGNYYKF